MAPLSAALMLLLVCINYAAHHDAIYPGFLQALLWFVALSLYLLTREMFVPVADPVFVLIVAGAVFFSMGAFVASYTHTPHLERTYVSQETLPSNRVIAVLAGIVTLGLVLYLARAQELASMGPTGNAFINLRYAVSANLEETGGFGATAYFIPLAYVLAAVMVLKRHGLATPGASRVVVAVIGLVGATFGLLWAARGVVLTLVVLVLAVPTVLRASGPMKAGTLTFLLAGLLFALVALPLGKGADLSSTLSENWSTMRQSFLTYAVGGIPALSAFLSNTGPDVELGRNSFRSVIAVMHAVGFQTTAPPLVQSWVDVPMPTNVYTVYQPYIKDFGAIGGVSVLFLLGFLHGALYTRATVRNPSAIYVFLFALSLFPLVMQVFQDMYFSLLGLWFQYGVWAVLFFVVLSLRRLTGQFVDTRIQMAQGSETECD